MSDIEIKRVKRGRPKKPIVEEIIIYEDKVTRMPRGRPRTVNITDKKAYNKTYYESNKDKHTGDYYCAKCNLICSVSNKSRHNQRYHSEILTPLCDSLIDALNDMINTVV